MPTPGPWAGLGVVTSEVGNIGQEGPARRLMALSAPLQRPSSAFELLTSGCEAAWLRGREATYLRGPLGPSDFLVTVDGAPAGNPGPGRGNGPGHGSEWRMTKPGTLAKGAGPVWAAQAKRLAGSLGARRRWPAEGERRERGISTPSTPPTPPSPPSPTPSPRRRRCCRRCCCRRRRRRRRRCRRRRRRRYACAARQHGRWRRSLGHALRFPHLGPPPRLAHHAHRYRRPARPSAARRGAQSRSSPATASSHVPPAAPFAAHI